MRADRNLTGAGALLHATTGRRVTGAVATAAPPVVVQSAAFNYGASPQTLAYPANVGAHNLLVVALGCDNFGVPSVTDSQGNTWSEASEGLIGGFFRVSVWWAKASSAGADSITVSTTNAAQSVAQIYEVSGVASGAPLDQANNTTSAASAPVTGPTFNGLAGVTDFVIHWAFYGGASNTPVGGIWTSDYTALVAGGHFVGAAYAITGPNVPGPTICPGNNQEFVLAAAAFHP